jgi:hypothetical protein
MKKSLLLAIILSCLQAGSALSWVHSHHEDRITGKVEIGAEITAVRTEIARHRSAMKAQPPAHLRFQCVGKDASVLIYVERELIASSLRNSVNYRFDNTQPRLSAWRPSADSSGVGLWTTTATKAFVLQAKGKSSLFFRVQNDSFGSLYAEFQLGDMTSGLEHIRSRCKI